MRTAVYRHFDEHDVLLYIGSSANLERRTGSHANHAVWPQYADHSTAQWYPNPAAAQWAEAAAIRTEHPVFNHAHAARGRNQRIERYFLNRGLANAPTHGEPGSERLVTLANAAEALMLPTKTLRNARDRRADFPQPESGGRPGRPDLYRFDAIAEWVSVNYKRRGEVA